MADGGIFQKAFVDVHECQIMFSQGASVYESNSLLQSKWKEDSARKLSSGNARTREKAAKYVEDIKNDVFMNDYKFMSYLLHSNSARRESLTSHLMLNLKARKIDI